MKYLLIKDRRRRVLFNLFEKKRNFLYTIYQNLSLDPKIRLVAYFRLYTLARDSSITRIKNRCVFTNRPRSIYKHFGLSRLMFRKYVFQGKLIGVKKSS
jgi:small subunit ribosomal protein S14